MTYNKDDIAKLVMNLEVTEMLKEIHKLNPAEKLRHKRLSN